MTHPHAQRLAEATEALAVAQEALAAAKRARDAEIVEAFKDGMLAEEITQVSGLSKPRVYQVLRASDEPELPYRDPVPPVRKPRTKR